MSIITFCNGLPSMHVLPNTTWCTCMCESLTNDSNNANEAGQLASIDNQILTSNDKMHIHLSDMFPNYS